MLNYQAMVDIGLAPDEDTLQDRLIAAVAQLGFGLSGGTFIRGRLGSGKETVRALGKPPEGFLEASRSVDVGLRDPLLTSILARDGCHIYDQAFYVNGGAAELWDNQAHFGFRCGMAISIHEPSHLEVFSFGVDGPDELPRTVAGRMALEASLRLLTLHAHEAARRLWTPPSAADLDALTKPEVEALRWAADAEVVWTHGPMTVVTRPGDADLQRSAARKLGAKTRSQAVLRAIDGGLIDR